MIYYRYFILQPQKPYDFLWTSTINIKIKNRFKTLLLDEGMNSDSIMLLNMLKEKKLDQDYDAFSHYVMARKVAVRDSKMV